MKQVIEIYEQQQIETLSANADAFKARGFLQNHRDLYPDLDIPPSGMAYTRGLTPLPLLLLMYDKVSVYIPSAEQSTIEARHAIPLDSLEHLCEAGIAQPIIGNPIDYDKPHLHRFLHMNAPSVWCRGLHALLALKMGEKLNESACPLPISEMAQSPHLKSRFQTRYPQADDADLLGRIKGDILVNYADLCIFGHQDLADRLVEYREPEKIVEMLYLCSEILAYPHLFGFGGTTNYDNISDATDLEFIPLDVDRFGGMDLPLDKRELDVFLKGIDLKITSLTSKEIIEFHSSGDGKRLRDAISAFEVEARLVANFSVQVDPSNAISAAEIMRAKLLDAAKSLSTPGTVQSIRRTDQYLDFALQCGSIAVGALVGQKLTGSHMGMVGGGAMLNRVFLPILQEKIAEGVRKKLLGPGLANLWSLKRKKK